MQSNFTKSYCSKCRRWLDISKFEIRNDRDATYSWCKACCKSSPLMSRVLVNDNFIWVMERTSREKDYPAITERGYGKIYG